MQTQRRKRGPLISSRVRHTKSVTEAKVSKAKWVNIKGQTNSQGQDELPQTKGNSETKRGRQRDTSVTR